MIDLLLQGRQGYQEGGVVFRQRNQGRTSSVPTRIDLGDRLRISHEQRVHSVGSQPVTFFAPPLVPDARLLLLLFACALFCCLVLSHDLQVSELLRCEGSQPTTTTPSSSSQVK